MTDKPKPPSDFVSALKKATATAVITLLLTIGGAILMGAQWQSSTDARLRTTTARVVALELKTTELDNQMDDLGRSLVRVSSQLEGLQHELQGTRQDMRELRTALAARRNRR